MCLPVCLSVRRCSPHVREKISALAESNIDPKQMLLLTRQGRGLPGGMAQARDCDAALLVSICWPKAIEVF
jgi:hypothetical protein